MTTPPELSQEFSTSEANPLPFRPQDLHRKEEEVKLNRATNFGGGWQVEKEKGKKQIFQVPKVTPGREGKGRKMKGLRGKEMKGKGKTNFSGQPPNERRKGFAHPKACKLANLMVDWRNVAPSPVSKNKA